jgi:hypothetical protein
MDDLRETIRAAMTEGASAPSPEPEQAAAAAQAQPEPDAKVTDPAPEAEDSKATGQTEGAQPRGPDGKFAPKDAAQPAEAAAAAPNPEPAAPAPEKEPQAEATPIPPSLPAAVKAKWATLDPDVQKAFAKIEESVQTAKAEWGRKGERLNRLEEIIAPHRDAWAVQGLDDQQALTRLVAAEKVLRETPAQGIVYLAQAYGVDLTQLAQSTGAAAPGAQPGQPGLVAPAQSADPALSEALEQIRTLKTQVEQLKQGTEQASLATVQAQIAEFSSKPENLYFENVREDVARRLETGAATTLQDAYDQAIWASPEIRPLLLKAEQDKIAGDAAARAQAAQAEAQARAKAQAAQHASGSVTGAPGPGATAPRPGSTGDLREDILASMKEVSATV